MRGRFLLFAASVLTLLPAVQAAAPTDLVRLQLPADWQGPVGNEVCVDVSSVRDDPTAVVVIAAQCTLTAKVSVTRTNDGHVIVEIVVYYVVLGQVVGLCLTQVIGPDGQNEHVRNISTGVDVIGDPTPACMT